jgi:hypothetical protein
MRLVKGFFFAGAKGLLKELICCKKIFHFLSADFVHPHMGVDVLCTVNEFLEIHVAAGNLVIFYIPFLILSVISICAFLLFSSA